MRASGAVRLAESRTAIPAGHIPILSRLKRSRARAEEKAAERVIVARGRRSVGLARVYRVSDRSMSDRYPDLVQRRVSRAWPLQPSIQSVTNVVKYERLHIALFKARLASDVRLAPGRLFTPDFAVRTRRLLAALGQPHKIYDGGPCALSQEPAAEDGCALTTAT